MALRLVRQTSDTPNITNKDDTIMTRYAYGGYNGIVKGFGQECNYTAENGIFKVLDGEIIIDGWEIQIDGAGWSLNLSNVIETQYRSIYAEINVATESVKLDSTYLLGSYPEVDKGDDLTKIPNGIARLVLYNLKVENGSITDVVKKFEIIPYLTQKVLDIETSFENFKYDYNKDKQTIEERLTKLGFKSGTFTFAGESIGSPDYTDTTQNGIYKLGKFVILKARLTKYLSQTDVNDYINGDASIITILSEFSPKNDITFNVSMGWSSGTFPGYYNLGANLVCSIAKNGTLTTQIMQGAYDQFSFNNNYDCVISAGWEIE